jgi:N-acetyl-anhydromuramyl-L-alanine amidase AmpD
VTMLTPADWEASEPKIQHIYIVVHHTDGPAIQTVEEINTEHQVEHHWTGIGYHRVIYNDGTIHPGRPDDVMGAQAQDLNSKSIGVVVTGDFTLHLPPRAQWDGLVHCLAVECNRWNIPVKNIIGHRDVAKLVGDPSVATSCPGDALYAKMQMLRVDVIQEMEKLC